MPLSYRQAPTLSYRQPNAVADPSWAGLRYQFNASPTDSTPDTPPATEDNQLTEPGDCVYADGKFYFVIGNDGVLGMSDKSCDGAATDWLKGKETKQKPLVKI
jgi:hypothetical protein